jgi:hypothetical protein
VLAELVGRSESWLSQVERGLRSIDSHSVLVRLAEVLGVEIGQLTPNETDTETVKSAALSCQLSRAVPFNIVCQSVVVSGLWRNRDGTGRGPCQAGAPRAEGGRVTSFPTRAGPDARPGRSPARPLMNSYQFVHV